MAVLLWIFLTQVGLGIHGSNLGFRDCFPSSRAHCSIFQQTPVGKCFSTLLSSLYKNNYLEEVAVAIEIGLNTTPWQVKTQALHLIFSTFLQSRKSYPATRDTQALDNPWESPQISFTSIAASILPYCIDITAWVRLCGGNLQLS